MLLESQSQFDAWLEENHFLHDASLTELSPLPDSTSLPDSVKVTFQFQIAGGYTAGDERTIRTIRLVAYGVRTFDLNLDTWHKDHCAECMDSSSVAGTVGFEIDVPSLFTLNANTIEVISTIDSVESVPRWLSDREFIVTASKLAPPTPARWLECFMFAKHDVGWRYFAGDERHPSKVPVDSYSGWFVQFRNRLKDHNGGLLFDYCSFSNDGFSMSVRLEDPEYRELWVTAGLFLASLPDITIRCGNAILETDEFESYLNSTLSCNDSDK